MVSTEGPVRRACPPRPSQPGGHAIDFDPEDNLIGIVLVNRSILIDHLGELRITWRNVHVSHDDRAAVFAAAA